MINHNIILVILATSLFLFSCQNEGSSAHQTDNNSEVNNPLGDGSDLIRINQLGYFPNAKKVATFVGQDSTYVVFNLKNKKEVLSGRLEAPKETKLSDETIQQFNFSSLSKKGEYQIKIGEQYSHPFVINDSFYQDVLPMVAKSYYYQRVGTEIPEQYGGKWHRQAGHLDTEVNFHPDTGKTGTISSPKGWYDAGDFGKYVSPGGFSTGQLLHALERYPNIYEDGSLHIPESGNGINDFLDEIKYEIDWIATMQDDDGGVFHKLTTKRFSGAIMPHEGVKPRFIMPKSSSATFDFAALLAKMNRHYKQHDASQALQWLSQAEKAWQWGVNNPNVSFKNPDDVKTGEYGDNDSSEEQFWAAAELYKTTEKKEYLDHIQNNIPNLTYTYGDGWKSFMRFLGVFTLLHDDTNLPLEIYEELKFKLLSNADELVTRINTFDYQQGVNSFQWASNSDVQNVAYVIAEAYHHEAKPEYLDAVLSSLNYLFGHNAVGYSMITGTGDKSPMNIHHRQSKADDIKEPIPGFVCGGPNYGQQDVDDGVHYPENVMPMQSYQDVWESYASNEVCLNWNSPTPYLIKFAIEEGNKYLN